MVARRSHEIGIRMALGAARSAVLRQVLRKALSVAVIGVVVGGLAAFWTTRVLASILFGLSARDPLTLITVVIGLLVTALVASYLPARRAACVDPARVLRAE
jgi:ABC-type antimicrobial peptide transport system permease subunit